MCTFSGERGLYEESTFWNTRWGTPIGANQTTTVDDLLTTAVANLADEAHLDLAGLAGA